jgi:ribosomal protein L16 Arg81 hydroxylase
MRVRDIERSDAGLAGLHDAVRRQFCAEAQINLYLTPPQRQGFPPHFDTTDVFVVQIAGAKAWRLFHDYSHHIKLPTLDTVWDSERYTPQGEAELVTLVQGDVLYIPRGGMHAATSLAQASMHLTISLAPMTFADLLTREIARIAHLEEGLRKRVSGDVNAQAKVLLTAVMERLDAPSAIAIDAARRTSRPVKGALRRALLGQGPENDQ